MPPEHSESLEQGSLEASLPEPDSASLASEGPPSDTRIEEGEPEPIGAPPSLLTGVEPAQAVEPPRNKSAMTLRDRAVSLSGRPSEWEALAYWSSTLRTR